MARRDRGSIDPSEAFCVPFDGSFRLGDTVTECVDAPDRRECKTRLEEIVEELADLQRVLYAEDRRSLLCIFQAMDAAGKDSTIRAVTSGINPAGFQVSAFKRPSDNELDHDFLWRSAARLPQRGRIGIFNRSVYEEVLVVRVHPAILASQRVEGDPADPAFWNQRFASIREHEAHLARNGTVILKFFLHVSRDEQRRRLLDRAYTPEKRWKFSAGDVRERRSWDAYMAAYEHALNATSREHAPWFVIPADNKSYMRLAVAEILLRTMQSMNLRYPSASPDDADEDAAAIAELESE